MIDSPTRGIIVQYGNAGEKLVIALCSMPMIEKQFKLLKEAQRYSINLFPHEFDKLAANGIIHEIQESGIFYLEKQYYSNFFGWSNEPVSEVMPFIC